MASLVTVTCVGELDCPQVPLILRGAVGLVVPMPTLPVGEMVNLSALLVLITSPESVPTLNKVEVADWRESLRIESEEVL